LGLRAVLGAFSLVSAGLLLLASGCGACPDGSRRIDPQSTASLDSREKAPQSLILPIDGLRPSDIRDTFHEGRGGHLHEATDLMAPRGTPVRAVCNGTIRKLFLSKAGGNTVYEFDSRTVFCYYYAHLDRYAAGLKEGQAVRQGDLIGYVGTTGNADPDSPHLHFAVFRLGPEKEWWRGEAVDPYSVLLRLARDSPR
jgi:murein DD-endopeptidase MepM/ murein hydrolase activator NlpD